MKKSGKILIIALVLCLAVSMRASASLAGGSLHGNADAFAQESYDTSAIGAAAFSEGGNLLSSEGGDGEQAPGASEGNGEEPGPPVGGPEDPDPSEGNTGDQDPSEGNTGDQDPGSSGEGAADDPSGSGDGDTSEEAVTPEDPTEDPGNSGEGRTGSGAEESEDSDNSDDEYPEDDDEGDDDDDDDYDGGGANDQNAGTAALRGIARGSVVDAVSASRLDGAAMSIVGPDGTVVISWESGEEAEIIRNLEFGKEYTIKQDRAPKGYRKAAELKFTIDANNNVTLIDVITADSAAAASESATASEAATASESATASAAATGEAATAVSALTTDEAGNTVILIRNEMNMVHVLTVDASDRKALEGVKLRIFTDDGTTVDEWISGPDAHAVERIEAGKYTVREISTPDSYLPAEDIEFTIDEKGKTETAGAVLTDEDGRTVLLVENAGLSFVVTKVAADTGESLEGAELALFEAEYADEGSTAAARGAAPIAVWTSEKDGSYDFGRYMRRGAEYVLAEIASPDGFEPIEDIPITVEESGEIRADLPSGQADNGSVVYLVEGTRAKPAAPVEPANKTNGNRLFSLLGDHAQAKLAAIAVAAAAAVIFVIRGAIRS